ncbi:MAG: methyl-accepting chemotaxis protein, partial [Leptospiraceae bacterium]|nr:methyl-accepting chemotaxis protein [Leptospiraceae bacterium]
MLEASKQLELLSLGTIELSLERSVSQVALNIPTPIPLNLQTLLKNQRALGTPKIEEVIQSLADSGSNYKAIDRLKAALIELNHLRSLVDRNITIPFEQRDKNFINNFSTLFPEVIEEIQTVRNVLNDGDFQVSNKLKVLESIANYAWEVREFAGRERTYFAIALYNKQSIPSDIQERMKMLDKKAHFAWKNLHALNHFSDLPQEILSGINPLEKGYFVDYNSLRDKLKEEAITGNYSIGFSDYFEKSSLALKHAEDIVKTSVELTTKLAEEQKKTALVSLVLVSFFTVIALFSCTYLLFYLNRKVIGNIIKLNSILDSLSKGNKDIDYSGIEELQNEIGSMINASKIFRENLLRLEKLMVEQSSAVNETTQVVEMLDKSSKLSAEQASQVSQISQQVLKAATEGEEMVNQMKNLQAEIQDRVITINDYIKELEFQTNQIGSITDAVSELAKQTNMLALNAAVEASRAGEFGRGFAVVSIEIRKLSDESKNSANKIQGLIDEIKKSVKKTVTLT